eukprot:TRINITY_DN2128_c3_g1_i1.p1 TRINITY_DN2128_c3_g1~~TRINITY_DN2128_c3_g1_i1.p1  ORF type:complete len:515 (-),score=141.81 TRINITY_DN2128_c3_g1_i1:137-1681(-)
MLASPWQVIKAHQHNHCRAYLSFFPIILLGFFVTYNLSSWTSFLLDLSATNNLIVIGFIILLNVLVWIGRLIETFFNGRMSRTLIFCGAIWYTGAMYGTCVCLLLNLLYYIDYYTSQLFSSSLSSLLHYWFVETQPGATSILSPHHDIDEDIKDPFLLLAKRLTAYVIGIACLFAVFLGHKHARTPHIKTVHISIDRPCPKDFLPSSSSSSPSSPSSSLLSSSSPSSSISLPSSAKSLSSLHIVALSDLHLGTLVEREYLAKVVSMVNSLHPDIVVLLGDLLDEIQTPVYTQNIGAPLAQLQTKMGVFAVLGNHDCMGGLEACATYMHSLGVHVLRNECFLLHGPSFVSSSSTSSLSPSFSPSSSLSPSSPTSLSSSPSPPSSSNSGILLLGRDDVSVGHYLGRPRPSINSIFEKNNISLKPEQRPPVIILDHQPQTFKDSVSHQIDLQLSGHTHAGQTWPLQKFGKLIFKHLQGHHQVQRSHLYVTAGIGTAASPIRLFVHPEITDLHLHFQS